MKHIRTGLAAGGLLSLCLTAVPVAVGSTATLGPAAGSTSISAGTDRVHPPHP